MTRIVHDGCGLRLPENVARKVVTEGTSEAWATYGLGGSSASPFRYVLSRTWIATRPHLIFVGINPSTATHAVNDHTITKLVGFATKWSLGGLVMLNVLAFRARDPRKLVDGDAQCGPANAAILEHVFREGRKLRWPLLLGYGQNAQRPLLREIAAQTRWVARLHYGSDVECLGVTGDGHPNHPLMLAYATPRVPLPYVSYDFVGVGRRNL